MNRRSFVTGLGALLAAPLAAEAQQAGRVALIGFLETGSLSANSHLRKAFRERLRELGHIEGQSVRSEARGADGKIESLADLKKELVRLKAEAIVTAGTEAAVAAKRVTSTIPIVTAIVSDPVGVGLIASLARPGGNVTGVADLDVEQSGKRLEMLKTVVPGLSRIAPPKEQMTSDGPGRPIIDVWPSHNVPNAARRRSKATSACTAASTFRSIWPSSPKAVSRS